MNLQNLLHKLAGTQTIESVMDILNLPKKPAIYYVGRLRHHGYVKTKRLSNNRRVYDISMENKLGGQSYDEIINRYSPVKIATSTIYRIYGQELTLEETLIYALKTKSLRTILAALALFRRIDNWLQLYALAKKEHLVRQVGALYDLARKMMRVRRMPQRFRHYAAPKERDKYEHLIPNLASQDFQDIEKVWKVYLPFNKKDLEEYA